MDRTTLASVSVFVSACAWGLVWLPIRYFVDQGLPGGGGSLGGYPARQWYRKRGRHDRTFRGVIGREREHKNSAAGASFSWSK